MVDRTSNAAWRAPVRMACIVLALLAMSGSRCFGLGSDAAPVASGNVAGAISPSGSGASVEGPGGDASDLAEEALSSKSSGTADLPSLPESHERSTRGRFSYEVRGGFLAPENDLNVTSTTFPQFSVGAQAQFRLREVHQIRPVGEWWYFRPGHQQSRGTPLSQTLDTNVRALALGGEYLYRIGRTGRLSVGGELYLMRWSVRSVNTITDGALGSATSSGTSSWYHLGYGPAAGYRVTQRLELQSRWVRSHYGYEHIPISVLLVGAAWRL